MSALRGAGVTQSMQIIFFLSKEIGCRNVQGSLPSCRCDRRTLLSSVIFFVHFVQRLHDGAFFKLWTAQNS